VQQAKNVEAERRACEIRLRAERRCGQLLRQREKAKGAPGNQHTGPLARCEGSKPLADLGISHTQSSRWQKLAEVPEVDFEAILAAAGPKPTTTGIIEAHTEPKPTLVDPKALWLWGRLLDFRRQGQLTEDPNVLIGTMLDHMQETTCDYAPEVAAWLNRIRRRP
jgi:hypothetical protein